jgi:ketosteroid isomerase-like protein
MPEARVEELPRRFFEAVERGDRKTALGAVRALYEAGTRGDWELVYGFFDPEIEWIPPTHSLTAGTYRGPEQAAAEVKAWTEPFADFEWEPRDLIVAGDRIVVEGVMRGRGRESGVEVKQDEFHVWTVRNGKIVRLEMHHERAAALRAAGLGD